MIHPVFRLLISDPGILADHASGYAELVQAEAVDAARALQRRGLRMLLAGVLGLIGLISAAVAALLAAALPVQAMPLPWLLVLVPGLCLAVALGLALREYRSAQPAHFAQLRAQWVEDLRLLQAAGQ